MGNSESSLEPYTFAYPKAGDFDLSNAKVYIIDDKDSASAAEKFLRGVKVLYVDCEGDKFGSDVQQLGTVQIATDSNHCFIFHIAKYSESLDFLKTIFEDDDVRKVFHDCSGDSAVLFSEGEIRLSKNSTDDTQIAHKVMEARRLGRQVDHKSGPSLKDLCQQYCGKSIPGHSRVNNTFAPGQNRWNQNTELSDGMVKYAAVHALAVREIFIEQEGIFEKDCQYRSLVENQIKAKIRSPDFEKQEESSCIIS